MNIEQIAAATQSNIINDNQGNGVRSNGRAQNRGNDDCCINGVGSKTKELLDQIPPCTGISFDPLKIKLESLYLKELFKRYYIPTNKIFVKFFLNMSSLHMAVEIYNLMNYEKKAYT